MIVVLRTCAALATLALLTSPVAADNWPTWRGPLGTGVSAEGTFPLEWSNESSNVVWKAPLPGGGGSTPAIWGERIFVTCPHDGNNSLLCFTRTGRQLWERLLGSERPGKHKKGSGSNPSPVTDGEHVYVYYKSGELACVDFDGNVVWNKNLQDLYGEDTLWWDLGTSPVLTDKHIVIACIQSGPSYVAAFDKGTGEEVWKHERKTDALNESQQSYATPVIVSQGSREVIIVLGADCVSGHDAESGVELWRIGGLNPQREEYWRSIASPVAQDGIVYVPYARGDTLTAVQLEPSSGAATARELWTKHAIGADVPTPVVIEGRVYVCFDKGEVACLDAKSGNVIWQGDVEKNRLAYSASPVAAGGHLYITREDGTTFVLEQGDEFNVVAKNELHEKTLATPVFADDQMFIRTYEHLYCIGY